MDEDFDPQKNALKQIMEAMSDRIGEKLKRVTITLDTGSQGEGEAEGMEPDEMGEEDDPFIARLKKSLG